MRDFSGERAGGGLWKGSGAGVDQEPIGQRTGVKGPPGPESAERMARLVRTIEGEIVPRLVLSRRVSRSTGDVKERLIKAPDAADVTELVRLLLTHDVDVASGYVEAVRHRGATLEMICLELLAPAARELGLLWDQDECDFLQVTVGLCRLHQVLRELSVELRPEENDAKAGRSILLAPIPGEQHTFGIMLVAQFLRRAGWDVWHEFPETLADILDAVRQNSFAVVGLSIGCDARLDDVGAIIRSIRCSSRNRAVGILIGGPVLVANPGAACLVGADGTAADGREAVAQADHIRTLLAATN